MSSINIINDYTSFNQFNAKTLEHLTEMIFNSENREYSSINFIITDEEYLSRFKKKYFNQNVYTDVMTFNLENSNEPIEGEIYVSMDRIFSNAKVYQKSLDEEVKRVMIHGILHLIGYNDDTKKKKENMTLLENKYISSLYNKALILK